METVLNALCSPALLDIALAPAGRAPLPVILASYGEVRWAMRGGFYDSKTGVIVGFLWVRGRQVQGGTGKDWPCLWIRGGQAEIIAEHEAAERIEHGIWPTLAAACGPLVVQRSQMVDDPRFPGVRPRRPRPRTAIGIRGDGRLHLVVYPAMTTLDVAEDLMTFGAVDALFFDGGHGTQVWDGDQIHTFEGPAPARIPWAWVVKADAGTLV